MSLAQCSFKWMSQWLPEQAADMAYHQMLTPAPFAYRPADEKVLDSGQFQRLSTSTAEISTWTWADTQSAPRVICVHGWSGAGVQFKKFIPALRGAGYAVTLIDLPAHGKSSGRRTHLPASAQTLIEVLQHFPDTQAVLAHSFGATATSLALKWGAQPDQVVLFAPMSDLHKGLGKVVQGYGATKGVFDLLRLRAEEEFNLSWSSLSPAFFAHELNTPALIVHDKQDRDVEFAQACRLQLMWPKSKLITTDGLGHYRILKDPQLIRKTVDFLNKKPLSI